MLLVFFWDNTESKGAARPVLPYREFPPLATLKMWRVRFRPRDGFKVTSYTAEYERAAVTRTAIPTQR